MQITPPKCRLCGADLTHEVLNLGMSPPCELFLRADQTDDMEPFYPLRLLVCGTCHLVQMREYVAREDIFTEYAYFSSFADSWVQHAQGLLRDHGRALEARQRQQGRRAREQ